MVPDSETLSLLQGLGLTQLEAEIYVLLLTSPPVTPYRIGKQIGKPTANVYKAVASLARKGALLVDDGTSKLCRAVPVNDFLGQTQRAFGERVRLAGERLARLEEAPGDERVYRLESATQLFERARLMLEERAERVIVLDAFPKALAAVLPSVRQAVNRGLDVFVQAYEAMEIPGASVAVAARGEEIAVHWASEQLNVVIDGREHLAALLSADLERVHDAVWSRSLYLSCLFHAGRLCEHTLHRLIEAAAKQGGEGRCRELLHRHGFFLDSNVPGQLELLRRHGLSATGKGGK